MAFAMGSVNSIILMLAYTVQDGVCTFNGPMFERFRKVSGVLTFNMCIVVPTGLMLCLYGRIFYTLNKMDKKKQSAQENKDLKMSRQVLRTLIIVSTRENIYQHFFMTKINSFFWTIFFGLDFNVFQSKIYSASRETTVLLETMIKYCMLFTVMLFTVRPCL